MSRQPDRSQWTDLPLIPLNTVLFPGMVLPLHIFEERYKLMVNHCLEVQRPFGVLLIRQESEVRGRAMPHEVGTTTVIAGLSRLADGRMDLVTVGSERFRVRNMRHDLPYLMGDAEPWPLTGGASREAQALVEPVRALFRHYLGLLSQAQGHKISIEEVPSEARMLALLVAIALELPLPQKQQLLDQPTVAHLLLAECKTLRREQAILDLMIRTQDEQWKGGFSGYLARN
jgi:hypothetical protein